MARPRGSGCVYRQKGSSILWISYYRGGKRYRESSHSADERIAERLLRKRQGEIVTGNFFGPQVERVRVSELAEAFLRDYRINSRKSVDDAEARWKLHLQPFFGAIRAVEVSSDLISRYIDRRQQEKAKNATINRELACLKRMFKLGAMSSPPKVYRVPHIPRLAENNVRKGFLTDEQYKKLIESCPELWFRTCVELGRAYGWRVSEILGLHVEQIDLLHRRIRLEVGTTKNKDGREVHMTDAIYELLRCCVEGKAPEQFVLTRPNGNRVKSFRGTWANARTAAGAPRLLFHDLRRTAARRLRFAGVPETVIMRVGGWKTRSVFERYAIVENSDIKDAIEKLEKLESIENGHKDGHSEPTQTDVADRKRIN